MSKIEAIHHEARVLKVTDRVVNGDHTTRYLVLENDDNYVKEIAIEAYGDKCDDLDSIQSGDMVKASFNLQSREWKGRYFSSFKFWKVEKLSGESSQTPNSANPVDDSQELPF